MNARWHCLKYNWKIRRRGEEGEDPLGSRHPCFTNEKGPHDACQDLVRIERAKVRA